MNKEALLKLKTVLLLDSVNKPKLDMNVWFEGESLDNLCGTTACAAGTAALHPWFQERGLTLELYYGNWEIYYGLQYGYAALASFFDILIDDAWYLFSPEDYPTGSNTGVDAVIDRIYELLNRD